MRPSMARQSFPNVLLADHGCQWHVLVHRVVGEVVRLLVYVPVLPTLAQGGHDLVRRHPNYLLRCRALAEASALRTSAYQCVRAP